MKTVMAVILGFLGGALIYKTVSDDHRWEAIKAAHRCVEVNKDRLVCTNGRIYRR